MGGLPNELIPIPTYPQTEGSQIGDNRLSTSCGVVERPDHHCGDDLVGCHFSGAGKTTLLNVLNQRNTKHLQIDGTLLVNGLRVGDAAAMSAVSGYVQQDDLFIATLTVKEQLVFQAMLRMDAYINTDDRRRRVDDVIREVSRCTVQDLRLIIITRSPPNGGEAKRRATKIRPKAVCGVIFRRLFHCSFRPEVVGDVISGADVGQVGMNVPVKFGDSSSNGSRDIQQRSRRMRHFRPFSELR